MKTLPEKSRTPPRTLMVVPQYPYPVVGGMEQQAHELAKALIELGYEVEALSGRILDDQPALGRVEGVPVHRIPWFANKLVRFLRTPLDLGRFLFARRQHYDVVHMHQCSWLGLFVILVARAMGKPVLTKLPSVGEAGLEGMAASRFGALKLAIFRRSDAVVALSKESIEELKAIGYPLHRVLATPNGIRLMPTSRRIRATDESSAPCRVVFVGRLAEEKRIPDLLHAWVQVRAASKRPVQLEIWGGGPLEAELRALSATLGIDDVVAFRGRVERVREKLADVDVFVLVSSSEGNSNAILEAMAARLPVVATRVGGTPLLVGPEGDRFLVERGDRAALAQRILELVGNEALRIQAGEAMHRRAQERFDIMKVANTYASAYAKLAEGRRNEVATVGGAPILET